ncbi:MAG: SAM-dependent methyltransferase, partial [Rhodomicrobium sp.]
MASNPAFHTGLTPLAGKLAARIAANGPISFHDYMEACLYDPEYGYYRNKAPLGRGGDFITAPEISQVFGEIIGLWAGEVWRLLGEPGRLRLIELGPGRGTLMADALRVLRVLPAFMKAVTVHLVETSEALRNAQARALGPIDCPIDWHGCIEEIPSGPTVLIANEFFDCLPVRQFQYDELSGLWRERRVAFGQGSFKFAASSPSPLGERAGVRGDWQAIEDGTIAETRPATRAILQTLSGRAAAAPFVAIVIDYGYSKPSFG